MPPRPRPSKVAKPNGTPRARKALSDEAQQELEQYTHTNGNETGPRPDESPTPISRGSMAPPQSSPVSPMGTDGIDSFRLAPPKSNYPPLSQPRYPTAAEIAYSKYGDAVKLDSALCKKVAEEPARREPLQRRHDQKLNIDRRSNMEAFMAHVVGDLAERPCKNCHKGHGPWKQCVVYDGQMCGSCTNCWYNASGSRCTFHDNAPSHNLMPDSAIAPINLPQEALGDSIDTNLPYYSPKPELDPIAQWGESQPDDESNQSSQGQPQAMTPLPVQPPAYVNYQPQTPVPHGMPNMGMVLGAQNVGGSWFSGDLTRRLVNQAMGDVAMLSCRDRHIARIETASEELAMRIAEYNEYMRTPEGMAEQQQYEDAAERYFMHQHHAHEAVMEAGSVDGRTMTQSTDMTA